MDTDERIWGPTPDWLFPWLHPMAFIRGACPGDPWRRLEVRVRRATQRLPHPLANNLVAAFRSARETAGNRDGKDLAPHTFPAMVRTVVREDGHQGPSLAETVVRDDAEWRERTGFGKGLPDVDPNAKPPAEDCRQNHGVDFVTGGAMPEGPRTELAGTQPVSAHMPTDDHSAWLDLESVGDLAERIDQTLCLGVFKGQEAGTQAGWRDGTKRVLRALEEQVKQRDKFAADLERVSQELAKSEEMRRATDSRPRYGIWCMGTRSERKECWRTKGADVHTFDSIDAAYETLSRAQLSSDGWSWTYEVRPLPKDR